MRVCPGHRLPGREGDVGLRTPSGRDVPARKLRQAGQDHGEGNYADTMRKLDNCNIGTLEAWSLPSSQVKMSLRTYTLQGIFFEVLTPRSVARICPPLHNRNRRKWRTKRCSWLRLMGPTPHFSTCYPNYADWRILGQGNTVQGGLLCPGWCNDATLSRGDMLQDVVVFDRGIV